MTPIPVMALRAAIADNSQQLRYSPWLLDEKVSQSLDHLWLFCWRAEGAGDRLSAHSRSVPWALVRNFYSQLQLIQPHSCLVYITNWKDWEARNLRGMGVEILDPRRGTLLELAQRCRISRVLTIDTALVHLCAAAGQQADLMLSAFPDSAGENYRPQHHYKPIIKIWQSSQFGCWLTITIIIA